ncbi:MAG TPA: hypothetical protein VF476_00710 [Chitinophagaceae bacterium]
MTLLRTGFFLLIASIVIAGCKQKKKPSMSGEEPVEVHDFIEFFQAVNLPFQLADSVLLKKEKDSLLIGSKVFSQFIPDSVTSKLFSKGAKPKIYPLGKAVSDAATYLFAKGVAANKKVVFVMAFDKKDQFITAMPLLRSDASKSMQRTTVIDKRFTITNSQLRKNGDGSSSEGKDVYALSTDTKEFTLIMTDALEDKAMELINPIDTMARKNKFSADYGPGKTNLVSIRDGRKSDRLSFFIHFEKNNGECTGELKGEAIIRSANLAEYRVGGDPCVLQFRFSSSAVTLKEIEGCGSRRGLRCTFDGSYAKKRETKPKTTKKK